MLRCYPNIRLKGLRKITIDLSQDNRSLGRDLKPGPPEHEAGVLTTRSRRSVPVATKLFSHLLYFINIFHQVCIFSAICVDDNAVNCVSYCSTHKGLFQPPLTGHNSKLINYNYTTKLITYNQRGGSRPLRNCPRWTRVSYGSTVCWAIFAEVYTVSLQFICASGTK
jgi:hypothetical protein